MRSYTAHLKPGRTPVLSREGWSWGAALFGPLWLAGSRAWIPALLELAGFIGVLALAPAGLVRPLLFGSFLFNGLLGRDLVRWSLERRGYALNHVVVAPDADAALLRLLSVRPELAEAAE